MSEAGKGKLKTSLWKNKVSNAHKHQLEFNGLEYLGYEDLLEQTGVSYHLYNKYYKNGIDPTPYVNNNTYAMVAKVKQSPPKAAKGKKWFNNGETEKYFDVNNVPTGWTAGRLK